VIVHCTFLELRVNERTVTVEQIWQSCDKKNSTVGLFFSFLTRSVAACSLGQ